MMSTDDLATLPEISENIILEELKRRYSEDRIYVSPYETHISYIGVCVTSNLDIHNRCGGRSQDTDL